MTPPPTLGAVDAREKTGRRGWMAGLILLVAVLVVVAVRQLHRPAPTPVPPPRADQIGFGGGNTATYARDSKEFVLQFDLRNDGDAVVRVRAATVPQDPGFARLATAVLPGFASGSAPTYDEVVAAGGRVIPLDPGSVAQLTVAGRVSCAPEPAVRDWLDVRVGDRTVKVGLPDVDDQPWSVTVVRQLCP